MWKEGLVVFYLARLTLPTSSPPSCLSQEKMPPLLLSLMLAIIHDSNRTVIFYLVWKFIVPAISFCECDKMCKMCIALDFCPVFFFLVFRDYTVVIVLIQICSLFPKLCENGCINLFLIFVLVDLTVAASKCPASSV